MVAFSGVPSWFSLKNYDALSSYSAAEWVVEIRNRLISLELAQMPEPAENDDDDSMRQTARDTFETIKRNPLLARRPRGVGAVDRLFRELRARDEARRIAINVPGPASATVRDLSQHDAFMFLYDSERRGEITKALDDCVERQSAIRLALGPDLVLEQLDYRNQSVAHLEQPLWKDPDWGLESIGGRVYLEVRINATDEQIVGDFARWLARMRREGFPSIRKRAFSQQDFSRWVEKKVLQYFDLTAISTLDGSPLTQNVLGQALFPDELSVDTTERVRKVIQPLVAMIFQSEYVDALALHAAGPEDDC